MCWRRARSNWRAGIPVFQSSEQFYVTIQQDLGVASTPLADVIICVPYAVSCHSASAMHGQTVRGAAQIFKLHGIHIRLQYILHNQRHCKSFLCKRSSNLPAVGLRKSSRFSTRQWPDRDCLVVILMSMDMTKYHVIVQSHEFRTSSFSELIMPGNWIPQLSALENLHVYKLSLSRYELRRLSRLNI